MKTIKYNGGEFFIEKSRYVYTDSLALQLININTGEPYTMMTVCHPHYTYKRNEIALNLNNFADGEKILHEIGIINKDKCLAIVHSDFCSYPVYEVDLKALEEYL